MGSNELQEKDATGAPGHDLSNGSSSNLEAARRLAKRLYHLDRFKRSDVAKHLGKKYVLIWGLWPHSYWCFCKGLLLNDNLYLFLCFSLAMNSASLWPKSILNFLTSQAWHWTVHSGTTISGLYILIWIIVLFAVLSWFTWLSFWDVWRWREDCDVFWEQGFPLLFGLVCCGTAVLLKWWPHGEGNI